MQTLVDCLVPPLFAGLAVAPVCLGVDFAFEVLPCDVFAPACVLVPVCLGGKFACLDWGARLTSVL